MPLRWLPSLTPGRAQHPCTHTLTQAHTCPTQSRAHTCARARMHSHTRTWTCTLAHAVDQHRHSTRAGTRGRTGHTRTHLVHALTEAAAACKDVQRAHGDSRGRASNAAASTCARRRAGGSCKEREGLGQIDLVGACRAVTRMQTQSDRVRMHPLLCDSSIWIEAERACNAQWCCSEHAVERALRKPATKQPGGLTKGGTDTHMHA